MNDYTKFEEILLGFCRKHLIGKIQPDEYLKYHVYVDGSAVICFMTAGTIYLQIDLGVAPPKETPEALFRQLLQQSLVDAGDCSCVLSMGEQDRMYATAQLSLADAGLIEFEEKVAELVNYSEVYEAIVASAEKPTHVGFYGMLSVCS